MLTARPDGLPRRRVQRGLLPPVAPDRHLLRLLRVLLRHLGLPRLQPPRLGHGRPHGLRPARRLHQRLEPVRPRPRHGHLHGPPGRQHAQLQPVGARPQLAGLGERADRADHQPQPGARRPGRTHPQAAREQPRHRHVREEGVPRLGAVAGSPFPGGQGRPEGGRFAGRGEELREERQRQTVPISCTYVAADRGRRRALEGTVHSRTRAAQGCLRREPVGTNG
ncbi:hypothetical protein VTK73DRAFT_4146 [Phialemonium thermophilum]|uniref:Uncharacterized protein n=1 Tax=Phialemonium thermophilum TaxID=223376 RepID=A0ABR3VBL3_9PEZI